MNFFDWCKENGVTSYKEYCTCGGYAWSMNRRNPDHPHMQWCAQYEEHEKLYSQYRKEIDK